MTEPIIYTLSNGLRIVYQHTLSSIVYCGFIVNVGTRDELPQQHGMAHYVEHLLFKGTEKRSARKIINSIETIGGEINAYTTKEETAVYGACMKEDFKDIVELLHDMTFNSIFSDNEREKELSVICDEIESYNDSPAELIFDDFETMLFGQHPLGNAILGTKESISLFNQDSLTTFHQQHYTAERMVFFAQGDVPFKSITQTLERLQAALRKPSPLPHIRMGMNEMHKGLYKTIHKDTHQTHFVCGGRAYSLHDKKRLGLYLLNNILGGPGMNSRLNLSLRERNGLVYSVEASYIPLSDVGYWDVYFGCEPENVHRCEQLVKNELDRLCQAPITDLALRRYKRQIKGQMAIAAQNAETNVLSMAKSVLRIGEYKSWQDAHKEIETFTADELQQIAQEIYNTENINTLKYV